MRSSLFGSLLVGLLAGTAAAQRLAAYDPIASTITELQPPTALSPVPKPPLMTYATVPVLPAPAPMLPMPGDSTYDNLIGLHWFTDGVTTLAAMPTPAYAPLGPVPAPIAIPPILFGLIGGPITGIALDPVGPPGAGPVMYMTSVPGMVVGVSPVAGLPVVVPPFPVPWLMGPGVAGLEWDGTTGSLWAVDAGFFVYHFLPTGAPLALPMLPLGPVPPGVPGDIAIDKIGSTNPAGFRRVYISGGGLIVDVFDPNGVPFPSGPPAEGLAFMDHPAEEPVLAGCEGCPGVMTGPTVFTTSVMSSGNAVFQVGAGGLPPFTGLAVFGFDGTTAPMPFPLVNGPGTCALGLTITPSLIMVVGAPADAAGNVYLPVTLAGVPVGAMLHNQNFALCPALPTGFVFSRLQTLTVGGF